jgi:hypothetical protein
MGKLLLLAALAVSSSWAQVTTGTILGVVKDASGAVVPGAKVRVVNEDTNIGVDVMVNSNGDYVAPNLTPAVYTVHVEAPGFKKFSIAHITLQLSGTSRQDIHLETGRLEQEVTVTAEAPVINSETSSISSVVDSHAVQNLPLDGRTLDNLVLFTPGMMSDSASNPRLAGSLYWGGNSYSVDGVAFNDTGNGGAAYSLSTRLTTTPSVDTVQEIKVESMNARAESEGSASISMITKAGTNRLRISLYEYHRDRALTAKNFFATNLVKPQFNRNEFGAAVSGPIIRNRTFFSLSYEGLIQNSGRATNLNVATDAMRAGNFGSSKVLDPLANQEPFPNNQIPASRFDPRSVKLMSYLPTPNIAVPGFNYGTNVLNKFDVNRGSVKVDHKLTNADSLAMALSYSIGDPYFVSRGTPNNYGNWSDAGYITKSGSLSWTRPMPHNAVNDMKISYFSHASVRLGQNLDFDPSTIVSGLFTPLPIGGLPTVSITGTTGISDYGGGQRSPQITIQFIDNYTFIRGSHTFKTGADIAAIRVSTNPGVSGAAFGSFTFNARYTGSGFGDFLLGFPVSSARETPTQVNLLHQTRYSAYFQDDWKVTPRLTLNLGIRYMLQTVMQERDNSWSNFDFATGQFVIRTENGQLPKTALPRLLNAYPYVTSEKHGWGSDMIDGDHNNFGPRFGFAWRPFADNKTVIRGGYGWYFSMIPAYIGIRQLSLNNSPFFLHEDFSAPAGTVPSLSLANPFPASGGAISANPAITAVNRNLRNPLSQQWNFTIERQLLKNMGLRLTYLGNRATHVPWYVYNRNLPITQVAGTIQSNRPFQPWSDISTLDTNANSITHQLQVEMNRRVTSSLYLMTNFTWNKSLDNAATVGGPQNPYNAAAERGNADGVRQLVLNLSGVYKLPFGRNRKYLSNSGWLSGFISGWNLSSLTVIRSGLPFSVSYTPPTAGWYSTRADYVGNPNVDTAGITQWFNPAAFRAPAPFTFGNSARNLLFGPGMMKVDTSLMKDFKITERGTLQFRAEAFNLPNHASFSNPAASLNSSTTIGRISATSIEARAVQFAVRLSF